jgi:hypothetical protein
MHEHAGALVPLTEISLDDVRGGQGGAGVEFGPDGRPIAGRAQQGAPDPVAGALARLRGPGGEFLLRVPRQAGGG